MNKPLWSSSGITHVGGVRKTNQDAFADFPDKCIWAVADGMGGHRDGDFASAEIVNTLIEFQPEKTIGASIKKIYQRLNKVNHFLIEKAALTGNNAVVGSTVAVLFANHNSCVALWSGDSRVYIFRRSELKQITRDHNHEAMLLAEGLSPDEIMIHPYAQTLTHAIGGEREVYLDAQIQESRYGDLFLLCSDGLNKEITDNEIEEILRQVPYKKAVKHLLDLALERGGRDNITLILVQFSKTIN